MIGEIKKNDSLDNKVDARVHSIIGTIINFIDSYELSNSKNHTSDCY